MKTRNVSRTDLVTLAAERLKISKVAAAQALQVYTDLIGEAVMDGAEIRLNGFGVFRRRHSAPRVLPNGEQSVGRYRVTFKAYSALNQPE